MILKKCKLIVYDNPDGENKFIIINENNIVIEDAIKEEYKLTNIDLNDLPSNIFNNVSLYLGNKYTLNDFNQIIEGLNFIFESDDDYNQYQYFKQQLMFNTNSEYGKELLQYSIFNDIIKKIL